jgi:hypothetical protein
MNAAQTEDTALPPRQTLEPLHWIAHLARALGRAETLDAIYAVALEGLQQAAASRAARRSSYSTPTR